MRLDGRPLLDNPVDHGLYVDDGALAKAMRALVAGLNVLVEGARGAGKTSLLRQCQLELRQRAADVVFVDAAAASDPTGVLLLIGDALSRAGCISAQGLSTIASDHLVSAVRDAMRSTSRYLDLLGESKPAVVLIDNLVVRELAYTLFGQLRDRLWQLPLTWAVAAPDPVATALHAPPADAFFAMRAVIEPLSDESRRALLQRRLMPGNVNLIDTLAKSSEGNPRRLLDMARGAAIEGIDAREYLASEIEVESKLAALGRPASMLFHELMRRDGTSASDPEMLAALGWTRPRASQVLLALMRAGLVEVEDEPQARGRPRRVYRPIVHGRRFSS